MYEPLIGGVTALNEPDCSPPDESVRLPADGRVRCRGNLAEGKTLRIIPEYPVAYASREQRRQQCQGVSDA